jgi:hypothetical protein
VTLVAVDPLNRRLVAETDRVGRGALKGNAPSLAGARLFVLEEGLEEAFVFGGGSLGVRAGGEITGALEVVGIDEVVTGVMSVAVVGGPMFGLAGGFRGLWVDSSDRFSFAELFELDTATGSSVFAPNMVVPMDWRRVKGRRSLAGELLLDPGSAFSSTEVPDEVDIEFLARYSPAEGGLISSERLDGLTETEKRLSVPGLEEGGGMLILGLSIVVFVCSVLACDPFLIIEEPLVADKRVCEFALAEDRDGMGILVDPELDVEDTTLVRFVSSGSEIPSGICSSRGLLDAVSAIPTVLEEVGRSQLAIAAVRHRHFGSIPALRSKILLQLQAGSRQALLLRLPKSIRYDVDFDCGRA